MMKRVSPLNALSLGFSYFLGHPKLWLWPLFATLVAIICLMLLFFFGTYYLWPSEVLSWYEYTWGIFKALGASFLQVIVAWLFVIPVFFTLVFQSMVKKALLDEKKNFHELSYKDAFVAGIVFLVKTLRWRIGWAAVSAISLFIFPPLTPFIGQIAIGHVTTLDATGVTLILKGAKHQEQVAYLKSKRKELLTIGFLGGVASFLLMFTFIGWMFLIPAVYLGVAFFIMSD